MQLPKHGASPHVQAVRKQRRALSRRVVVLDNKFKLKVRPRLNEFDRLQHETPAGSNTAARWRAVCLSESLNYCRCLKACGLGLCRGPNKFNCDFCDSYETFRNFKLSAHFFRRFVWIGLPHLFTVSLCDRRNKTPVDFLYWAFVFI